MSAIEQAQKIAERYKTLRHIVYALVTWLSIREIAGKVTKFDLNAVVSVNDCSDLKTLLYIMLALIALLLVAIYVLYRYYERQREITKQVIQDKQIHIEGLEKQLAKKRPSSKLSKDGETKAGD